MMAKLAKSPVTPEIAAAMSRMATSGSAKRFASLVGSQVRRRSTTVFRPNCRRRSRASLCVKPAFRLRRRSRSRSLPRRQNASFEGSFMRSFPWGSRTINGWRMPRSPCRRCGLILICCKRRTQGLQVRSPHAGSQKVDAPPCCRPGTRIAAATSELVLCCRTAGSHASGIGAIVEIGRARRPAGPPHPPTLLAADRLPDI
jgi:hypothetical protein